MQKTMNVIVQQEFPVLKQTLALRTELLEAITGEDLAFGLGGDNLTLGQLCKQMGETQQSYINSFREFKQDLTYQYEDASVATDLKMLKTWFEKLDADLFEVLESLSDEDIQSKVIERGHGFSPPVRVQLHIFRESLLIFYAKASVYLKALGKNMPQQWQAWIG